MSRSSNMFPGCPHVLVSLSASFTTAFLWENASCHGSGSCYLMAVVLPHPPLFPLVGKAGALDLQSNTRSWTILCETEQKTDRPGQDQDDQQRNSWRFLMLPACSEPFALGTVWRGEHEANDY